MGTIAAKYKCTDNEGIEHELNYTEWGRWHVRNGTGKGNTISAIMTRHRCREKKGYTDRQVFGFEELEKRDYSKPIKRHKKTKVVLNPLMRSCLAKMARG